MRLAFMGSPDFAVPALLGLHGAGHEIVAVYCQRPKPAGRGYALRSCPVQVAAERLGLEVRTPTRLRADPAAQQAFAALRLDAAVVAAYGLILPQAMLDAPQRGCLNIHASLLPRWRGAAPIQAAVLAGDAETGVTIMQMDAGLDTGPMLLREAVPITSATTAASLHDALAKIGARLILHALAEDPPPLPQPVDGVTYAPKLTRDAGRIDWTRDAAMLDRQVRAFDPWPGTFTTLRGATVKVLAAELAAGSAAPGTVLDDRLTTACGAGALRLTRVQLAGRPAMAADAFLRGHPVSPGTMLGGHDAANHNDSRVKPPRPKSFPSPLGCLDRSQG
jgi:methionyl-tRNA formyltransferase